jgi:hypothetical protein
MSWRAQRITTRDSSSGEYLFCWYLKVELDFFISIGTVYDSKPKNWNRAWQS